MNTIEETLEAYLLSTKFEHQSLVITVPKNYKESDSPQSSLSDFSQIIKHFTKVKNSLNGSKRINI